MRCPDDVTHDTPIRSGEQLCPAPMDGWQIDCVDPPGPPTNIPAPADPAAPPDPPAVAPALPLLVGSGVSGPSPHAKAANDATASTASDLRIGRA